MQLCPKVACPEMTEALCSYGVGFIDTTDAGLKGHGVLPRPSKDALRGSWSCRVEAPVTTEIPECWTCQDHGMCAEECCRHGVGPAQDRGCVCVLQATEMARYGYLIIPCKPDNTIVSLRCQAWSCRISCFPSWVLVLGLVRSFFTLSLSFPLRIRLLFVPV